MTLQSIISLIQTIIPFIFGAIITAMISYIFTKYRENQRLKIDLQIKTTDIIMDAITNFVTYSSKLSGNNLTFFVFNFDNYNIEVESNQQVVSKESNEAMSIVNRIKRENLEKLKENIRKGMREYTELNLAYFEALFEILSIMESREIILHKFVGIRNLLLDRIMKFNKMNKDFMLSYFCKIEDYLSISQLIDRSFLDMINKYQLESLKENADIIAIIVDLNTGIQNEYLSKLFKYKVPIRQPTDKTIPIYKPGFIYISEKDNTK